MEQVNTTVDFDINQIPEPEDINEVIMNLMVNPNLSPLNYFNDFTDGLSGVTSLNHDLINDPGIFELEDGSRLMTMTTHAMHRHLENDPQKAAEILVSRASRKLVCYGAKPIALTAMLYHINYSDPNGNFIASGIKAGLENAAKAYQLNISDQKIRFDYFGEHGSQLPTLIVSMVGVVPNNEPKGIKLMDSSFKTKGNNIYLLGKSVDDISTSDYLEYYHGISDSPLPSFDLDFEVKLQNVVKALIRENLIMSASPVTKGGLFFTLLRAGWVNGLGFDITTTAENRMDSFLFGEAMGRIIVGVNPNLEDEFVDFMYDSKVSFFTLGHVTKGEIRIDDESYGYIDKMSGSL